MCSGGSKVKAAKYEAPDPIPAPDYADYTERRRNRRDRSPGAHPNVLTSPLGVSGAGLTKKPTLLGS